MSKYWHGAVDDVQTPRYQRRATKIEPYREDITARLEEYPELFAETLYHEIKKQGYTGSARTVRRFVAAIRDQYIRINACPLLHSFVHRGSHVPGLKPCLRPTIRVIGTITGNRICNKGERLDACLVVYISRIPRVSAQAGIGDMCGELKEQPIPRERCINGNVKELDTACSMSYYMGPKRLEVS